MRGKVAKRLRKMVYGDFASIRGREYVPQQRKVGKKVVATGAIENAGRRKIYIALKKNYKQYNQ